MHKRVTISIDEEVLALAEARVAAGEAKSLSAFIATATAQQVRREELGDVMGDIMRESGNHPSAEDEEWIRRVRAL